MGACCTKEGMYGGPLDDDRHHHHHFDENECEGDEEDSNNVRYGEDGVRIRLQGFSKYISMHTQQGKKGINQDAMTVWEDFTEKDVYFCGVFDGHGPDGHKISRCVRDNLPSKLSQVIKIYQLNTGIFNNINIAATASETIGKDGSPTHNRKLGSMELPLSSWEAIFVKSFKEMDEELCQDTTADSFCSGSTAVTLVKQGDHLIIGNLGDSRAVLGARSGEKNQIVPVQLTVDLKPDTPSEAERIKKCKGRVFSLDEEPEVYRIWMPDEDCPGLAMSRAFGDFCIKDCGLISIPDVFHRKITNNDEFVVMATDGIWDALTNNDVVKIVASARKRSMAAKLLIKRAVRAWKRKYPDSKIDDCAVICLFLKDPPLLSQSSSHGIRGKITDSAPSSYCSKSTLNLASATDGVFESADSKITGDSKEEWESVGGVDTIMNLPRYSGPLSWRKTSKDYEEVKVEAH